MEQEELKQLCEFCVIYKSRYEESGEKNQAITRWHESAKSQKKLSISGLKSNKTSAPPLDL